MEYDRNDSRRETRNPERETRAQAREEVSQEAEGQAAGLCGNCEHASFCAYLRSATSPTLQCEEHSARPGNQASLKADPDAFQDYAGAGAGELKGLCMNCANAPDCRLPKAAGGVWHCSEYL